MRGVLVAFSLPYCIVASSISCSKGSCDHDVDVNGLLQHRATEHSRNDRERVSLDWYGAAWSPDSNDFAVILYQTLVDKRGPQMIDFVNFTFFPIAKTQLLFQNGTSFCPGQWEDVHGNYDPDCDIEKWELCLVRQVGPQSSAQTNLVSFLNCFEGEHQPNMIYAQECAMENGLEKEYNAAEDCFEDRSLRNELWEAQLALPVRDQIQHVPFVVINGITYDPWNPEASLQAAICNNIAGERPEGCAPA